MNEIKNAIFAFPELFFPFPSLGKFGEDIYELRRISLCIKYIDGTGKTPETAMFAISEAVCHKNDRFVKSVGRQKTYGMCVSAEKSFKNGHEYNPLIADHVDIVKCADLIPYKNDNKELTTVAKTPFSLVDWPIGLLKNLDRIVPGMERINIDEIIKNIR